MRCGACCRQDAPSDYVICTGETKPLSAFVDEAFAAVGLAAKDHVEEDSALFRPGDLRSSVGTAAQARERLGWNARVSRCATSRAR